LDQDHVSTKTCKHAQQHKMTAAALKNPKKMMKTEESHLFGISNAQENA